MVQDAIPARLRSRATAPAGSESPTHMSFTSVTGAGQMVDCLQSQGTKSTAALSEIHTCILPLCCCRLELVLYPHNGIMMHPECGCCRALMHAVQSSTNITAGTVQYNCTRHTARCGIVGRGETRCVPWTPEKASDLKT